MTRVDFYFNAGDKLDTARKLATKAFQAGRYALLYVPDDVQAAQLETSLWTQPPLSFVPHVRCGHPLAGRTPVLIGVDPEPLRSPDVLVNLGREHPPFFSRFERLLEVVGHDPDDLQAARRRYRFYKERGYAINDIDLAKHG